MMGTEMSKANSEEPLFRSGERLPGRQVDLELKPIRVDHRQIQAVTFVTVVEDPLDDWADIWVDLRDGRRYSFTVYTPSMIARDMVEDDMSSHVDYDQLIVREVNVPCIVDGVSKMIEMNCIDRMGAGGPSSGRAKRRRSRIRAIEWDEAATSDSGTKVIVRLADGRRYRFTAFSISSIAQELQKPDCLSFVVEGLLVVRELNEDRIRKGLEEMLESDVIDRHGIRLRASK
jgi:hypothetical protein